MRFRPLPLAVDLMICLRFYSRLPIPPLPFEPAMWDMRAFGRAARAAPLAGLIIGAVAAMTLATARGVLELPLWIAAALALVAQIALSGALHEDGLADVADGFGGGADRRRKLEIMRDSRIGTFGALALIVSVSLRTAAIAVLLDRYGLGTTSAILVAVGAASRGFGLLPLATLPPARADGLAHAVGGIRSASLMTAMALSVFLGIGLPVTAGVATWRSIAASAAALLASFATARVAKRQIGGQTGDVSGAAQQFAEMAYLLTLLIAPRLG